MLDSINSILKSRKFPPVLLLFGEEDFLVEEAYHRLYEGFVDDSVGAFNCDIVDGSDITPERLVEMASAFPMMSDYRVVVVRHFEKMMPPRMSAKAQKQSPLAKYFAQPAPHTFLILLASAPSIAGIGRLMKNSKQSGRAEKKMQSAKFPYNVIFQHGEWIEFPKFYEREVPSWVAERFRAHKREIAPDACELLIGKAGYALRDLHNEIEKILAFVPTEQRLTRANIADVIGVSKTYNVFELQKSVGQKKIARSIGILQRMLHAEPQEMAIIAMLSRYFIIVWKLSEARRLSKSHGELSKTVGVNPYFIPEYLAVLDKYSPSQIERALIILCEAEAALKSSSQTADIALHNALINIMQ